MDENDSPRYDIPIAEDLAMHSRFLRIELTGKLSLGAYFLIAHWPDPETVPELEATEGPMALIFDTEGRALEDLKKTLLSVHPRNDALAESAREWKDELKRRGLLSSPGHRASSNDPSRAPRAG